MSDELKEPGLLFRGRLANGDVVYVEVPIRNGVLGAQIVWPDAVSSATILLELASSRGTFKDSGVAVTGPSAAGANSSLVNVENVRQKRARLKITAAAITNLDIWDGTDPA